MGSYERRDFMVTRRVRQPEQRGIQPIVPDGDGGWRLAARFEASTVSGKYCLDHAGRRGAWVPIADYYPDAAKADGLGATCKACMCMAVARRTVGAR